MEKIKLTIPENWSDVTLGQYIEFLETDFSSMKHLEKLINTISLLCDTDTEEVSKLSFEQMNYIIEELSWISNPTKKEYKHIITIDGVKYGSIPNFNQIKVGEWIDLENHMVNFNKNLNKILSVIYRPIIKYNNDNDYIIEDYNSITAEKRADLFLQKFNTEDAIASGIFFWNFVEVYLANTSDYLTTQVGEMIQTQI
jgi:hypothetical protein